MATFVLSALKGIVPGWQRHSPRQAQFGRGAGYFKPDNEELYFYNGDVLIADDLAPQGQKIPGQQWPAVCIAIRALRCVVS